MSYNQRFNVYYLTILKGLSRPSHNKNFKKTTFVVRIDESTVLMSLIY